MMKIKFILGAITVALMGTGGYIGYSSSNPDDGLNDLNLANAEALATDETSNYGCGYAAYEWDNDWYEDTKSFSKCKKGCPEGSGTSPKYISC